MDKILEENVEKAEKFNKQISQKIQDLGLYCFDRNLIWMMEEFIHAAEHDKNSKYKIIEEKFLKENFDLKIGNFQIAKRNRVNFLSFFFLNFFLETCKKRGKFSG